MLLVSETNCNDFVESFDTEPGSLLRQPWKCKFLPESLDNLLTKYPLLFSRLSIFLYTWNRKYFLLDILETRLEPLKKGCRIYSYMEYFLTKGVGKLHIALSGDEQFEKSASVRR